MLSTNRRNDDPLMILSSILNMGRKRTGGRYLYSWTEAPASVTCRAYELTNPSMKHLVLLDLCVPRPSMLYHCNRHHCFVSSVCGRLVVVVDRGLPRIRRRLRPPSPPGSVPQLPDPIWKFPCFAEVVPSRSYGVHAIPSFPPNASQTARPAPQEPVAPGGHRRRSRRRRPLLLPVLRDVATGVVDDDDDHEDGDAQQQQSPARRRGPSPPPRVDPGDVVCDQCWQDRAGPVQGTL